MSEDHNMNTKHENLYMSEEPVQKSDKSIHDAMKQALSTLVRLWEIGIDAEFDIPLLPSMNALRQAIEQAEKQNHTDHPLRHYDRTCPAYLAEKQEPVEESANSTKPIAESETVKSWEQEPVAWELRKGKTDRVLIQITNNPCMAHDWKASLEEAIPLYTAPPKQEWQGLTDEDIAESQKNSWVSMQAFEAGVWWADERLKEKNA